MRKFLLILIALFAVGTSYAAGNKVTVFAGTEEEPESKLDIKITSLAPATNIDADGYFTVAAAFDATIDESLAEDYMELDLYYTVKAEGMEPFSALANTDDLTGGTVNINIPELESGKEYTLTIDKIDVLNYSKADWETFEIPSEFTKEGDIASITFTIPMDIKITSLTPDTNLDPFDGTFRVELAYDLQMSDELKDAWLDAQFYYTVTCNGDSITKGQANPFDINDGIVTIYASNLEAGKEYELTIDTIKVVDILSWDEETNDSQKVFYQEGKIASTKFTIYDLGIKITGFLPDVEVDEDGMFKVTTTYSLRLPEELAEDYLDATFYYSLTDNGVEVDFGQMNANNINDGYINFQLPASKLEAGKEYVLTVNKIEVYNYSKMDLETFEIPLEFYQEGEIASTFVTIPGNGGDAINKVSMDEKQTIYNLNGVRLNKVTKGVNIINGKKFFVK